LLHDIGKKVTFSYGSDNIPHFYCHESIGGDMVQVIADRLCFSNEQRECITHAVVNHMRFAHVREMRQAKLKRLLAEKNFLLELELHRLDCKSSNGLMETYGFLKDLLEKMPSGKLPEPLINGHDLIKLGFVPGSNFKNMLNSVMDAQLEGVVNTKSEALEWVIKTFQDEKLK
jgi:poly(A) polymerase